MWEEEPRFWCATANGAREPCKCPSAGACMAEWGYICWPLNRKLSQNLCSNMGGKGRMSNIDELFSMLSWNADEETQKRGLQLAGQIKACSVFLQPLEDKSAWENCAKIFACKSDQELKPYLLELIKWLQDMNWPGAWIIRDSLKRMDWHILEPGLAYSIKLANKLEDNEWKNTITDLLNDVQL